MPDDSSLGGTLRLEPLQGRWCSILPSCSSKHSQPEMFPPNCLFHFLLVFLSLLSWFHIWLVMVLSNLLLYLYNLLIATDTVSDLSGLALDSEPG